MRIFLDTNVVMDYLTSRGDEQATEKIFESIDSGGEYRLYLNRLFLYNHLFSRKIPKRKWSKESQTPSSIARDTFWIIRFS